MATADSSSAWLSVTAWSLTPDAQKALVTRLSDPADPLTHLGLMRLAHEMIPDALGTSVQAASTLAAISLHAWFPLAAWCAGQGLDADMPLHRLLPAVYRWQVEQCPEPKDVARLNRRIFGRSSPW